MTVIPEALVEHTVKQAAVYDKFQFERIGFFSVDPDSNKQKVSIFYLENLICMVKFSIFVQVCSRLLLNKCLQ